jgi:hypothetical protein
MIRTRTTAVILGATLMFAAAAYAAGTASAAPFPDCAASSGPGFDGAHSCNSVSVGTAGYYGNDDNHTHYRFVETYTTANAHLVNLNGTSLPGAVGVQLCDPNTNNAQQLGLWFDPANGPGGGFDVSYSQGTLKGLANDPCIQDAVIKPLGDLPGDAPELVGPTAPTTVHINLNDQIYLGEYYDPAGHFFHRLSYGMCDVTQGWCRQAWSTFTTQQEYFEFGIGALSNAAAITGGAINPVDTFAINRVTCYSCASSVPITVVKGFYGPGGLTEAQYVNVSDQVQLSPVDSLNVPTDVFSLKEGSTTP